MVAAVAAAAAVAAVVAVVAAVVAVLAVFQRWFGGCVVSNPLQKKLYRI